MSRSRARELVAVFCCTAAALASLPGCGRGVSAMLEPNQPPELEIVSAAPDRGGAAGVHVRWAARDPDGRVAHYEWTRAPMDASRSAGPVTTTSASECVLPAAPRAMAAATGARVAPDLFSVWAVDDRGAASAPARLALFADNIAPTVTITGPQPSRLLSVTLGPSFCVNWVGYDPDGVFTPHPVKYKYVMLTDMTPVTVETALSDPDAVRRYYAPIGWAGWDSLSGDTTSTRYENLTPGKEYVFAITAFDEAGDYDPVFSLDKNLLHMRIGFPETLGPRIVLTGAAFNYPYPSGGWSDTPQRTITVEVPPGEPVSIAFSAQPGVGHTLTGYRWVLDPASPHDQTPRSDEATDTRHWSAWNASLASVSLPPLTSTGFKRTIHTFYLEASSSPSSCTPKSEEFVSLGIVKLVVVRPTSRRELLIVDDTRLEPDKFPVPGCPATYSGAWPSAAELDTFLYARGGVPWRCTKNPASGVTSVPGLFAGYDFDTLGTRGLRSGPQVAPFEGAQAVQTRTVPLSVLAEYRHVIWLTDLVSATYTNSVESGFNPMTALRDMSAPGQENVLASYVAMGGKLWVVGAGVAAMELPWDRVQNNSGGITRFSSAPSYGELGPGRMPWEQLHLRSEVSLNLGTTATRSLGRFESAPGLYGSLPAALQSKTSGTDPLPPTRTAAQAASFYVSSHRVEYLSQPNFILEDTDPDPQVVNEQPVLDTLYQVTGSAIPVTGLTNAAMAVYHGTDNAAVVWTGFDIWTWQRAQCMALVDWVLQSHWGITRVPVAGLQADESAALAAPATGTWAAGLRSSRVMRAR